MHYLWSCRMRPKLTLLNSYYTINIANADNNFSTGGELSQHIMNLLTSKRNWGEALEKESVG